MADRAWVQKELLRQVDRVKGFLYALTGDAEATEDCFQEVFLVAVDKAADFQPGTDFLAWLRTIARYRVLRRLEEGRRRSGRLSAQAVEALAAEPGWDDDERWEAERRALRACVAEVAPRARQILLWRYIDGLTPATIAARWRRSVNAVSVSLSKTRRFLRDCLQRRLAREQGG